MSYKTIAPNQFEVCGVIFDKAYLAGRFSFILENKGLLVFEYRNGPFDAVVVRSPTLKEIEEKLTLKDIRSHRNCGKKAVERITAALLSAGIKPSWALNRCPHCGSVLPAKEAKP